MAGGEDSEGKHGWKLPTWSTSATKSKRSRRWFSARHSQTTDTEHIQQDLASAAGEPNRPWTPEGSRIRSDTIRLLPMSLTPTGQTVNTTSPPLDNGPVSPPPLDGAQDSASIASTRTIHTPLQTRFREEFEPHGKDDLMESYYRAPMGCHATHDPRQSRRSELAMALWLLSVFSTIGSGIWLVTAIHQPRWGKYISSGGNLSPSTASLIVALLAKLIEASFVAVFVAFIGQLLTKRAFSRKSKGMTLAEISMRNWVIQPGLMVTEGPAVRLTGLTILGFICLVATVVGMLYTTASDALVSPKLKFGSQEPKTLQSYVTASYANLPFIRESCLVPIDEGMDSISNDACLAVSLSGASYHNFQSFMATWHDIPRVKPLDGGEVMANRPPSTARLFDNITMTAAWIEGKYSNPGSNFKEHDRIINNVTLAMPHPGVYLAATDPMNSILQPTDLSDVGGYDIQASAVSPSVNVLCANMEAEELAPLIYITWPDANKTQPYIPGQDVGWPGWQTDVPVVDDDEWLNETVVDDIFRWGPKYGRRPPVFPMYPLDFNLINNASVYMGDAIYILGKSNQTSDYTLCEMRSWLSPKCSTHFNMSGTAGAHMLAHCEDPSDTISYSSLFPGAPTNSTSRDWRDLADGWNLALYMNSGLTNANASRDRILTHLILTEPELPDRMPSFAEGLAVLVSSTLVSGSLHTPLRHYWDEPTTILPAPGVEQDFNVLLRTQEYTSAYNNDWQAAFYIVLATVFALNMLILVHFAANLKGRPLTDYTEPANLFALAINSPPSEALKGTCGAGPNDSHHLAIPYRIAYSESANHYYFVEDGVEGEGGEGPKNRWSSSTSGKDMGPGHSPGFGRTYYRLANSSTWL